MVNFTLELKTFETLVSIDSLAKCWEENERLIQIAADEAEAKHGPNWTPMNDNEFGEHSMERRMARELHDEALCQMFRYSSLVMLGTTVERELRRLVQNLEAEKGKQKLELDDLKAPGFLQQVNKFVAVFFGVQISDSKYFNSLSDLQKIRNCIVHCRGELKLVPSKKERAYLVSLNEKRTGFFAHEGTDLDIESTCIEQFIREVWAFFTDVFQKLNWKIDDSWQNTKWALSNTASLGSSTTKN